jgi:tetrathionate reductase subunit B
MTHQIAIDLQRCTGCHACEVACKTEHDVPLGNFRLMVYYRDHGKFPAARRDFLPSMCVQCVDAPCIKSCPTGSLKRGKDGIVRVQTETCVGTGKCVEACPYGAIYVDPELKVADKCDFCSNRLGHGLEPACVETCPTQALMFGADAERFLAATPKAEVGILKPDLVAKQAVKYRGLDAELGKKVPAGRNHDPKSYEIESW